MKNLLKLTASFGLILLFSACTATIEDYTIENESVAAPLNPPCDNEDPKTRVVNNGTVSFNLEVLTADGSTVVSILNIPPNSTTSWASFSENEVMFSLKGSNFNVADDKVLIQMDNCMAYEIEVNGSNEIVSYVPTIL
ncbi:hypothetical protein HNV10_09325 [Winogradskyella litoriviva]|uniref:Lipoprotein n=1 Tax=Winogradskyella litoriviva TaxID=1220182 RepID=A0ABX2E5Q7_9FLAO|nr:hypothetical protein [Winogradskyella litoriviva]NRD23438.1 hypothetical protein [Winogradskyella litoriviva]